jgi:hypothetical protein
MRFSVRRIGSFVAVATLALGSARLFAEDLDVGQLLDGAKAAVGEKKYGKALQDLQMAIGEIGRLRTEVLKGVMPPAPKDWTAEAAEGQNNGGLVLFGVGSTVRRAYKKSDEVGGSMELMADAGPLMAGLQMVLSNPALVSGNNRVVTVKGRRALLEYDADGKHGTLQIVLNAPGALLKVEGNGVSKADLVDVLAGAADLDAMEKAVQQ